MKTLKPLFFLLAVSFVLSACAPTPTLTPAIDVTSIPPTATMTATTPPTTIPTSTSTPLPTPTSTPEPVADLHDISTWPAEMQDYFNRPPEEWNNPTKQYASDVEFHRFILQARRDFLTAIGISEAGSMNKDALLLEYLKWGNDNKQILVLTPIELRSWYADTENIGMFYQHILPNNSGVQVLEGIYLNIKLQDNTKNVQELVGLLLDESFRLPVFGQEVLFPRHNYLGVVGDVISLFLLPGIPADQGIGILVHYVNEKGDHCYQPTATHFIPLTIKKGDLVFNAGGRDIAPIEADIVMGAAHTGALGGYNSVPITLDDLVNNIGLKIAIRPDFGSDGWTVEIYPWNLGLEGGQTFDFEQSPFLPSIIYPWSKP